MDCAKIGELIYALRMEKQMTQKQLADQMGLSDKTISKWERGLGCPDASLWAALSQILNVNIEDMLNGDLPQNTFIGGNMKKAKYYVCPGCGNITVCSGDSAVSCCGRKLNPLVPQKATEEQKLKIEEVEDEWFITSDHPMEKACYLSFLAFATGDSIQILKQYPEWELQVRLPKRRHGTLFWYSTTEGLFYQYI